MKSAKRILCAFLAVLTLLTLAAAGSVRPAYAAKTAAELEEEQRKAAQIAALEQKKKEQQEKLKELEKQIAEAKAKKEDVMVTKNLLDQRNQLLLEQIDDTQNQIDDAAAQIARYELLEQEQYELFCQQVRSEEERGSLSYLSVLFKATSMADLLNRMEFVNEVAEYNKTLIAAMKETRENIKAEKTEMEAKEAKLGEQQDELQGKLDETTNLMNEYAADQRELEKLYAAEEAAGKAMGLEAPPFFLCQSMPKLRLTEPVDAVVSTLDSLNYLTRESAIRETFRRVYRWLKPGGQFIFDVNSPYKLERMDGQMYMDETEDSFCVWRTFFSRRTQVCTYQVDLFRLNGEGTWDRDFEEHRERAWSEAQLRQFLAEAGFQNVTVTGDLTMKPPRADEDRWIFRAEKGE